LNFIYRLHAVERMFQRNISEAEVQSAVLNGEIIESYEDDKPYPSYLSLKKINSKAIHVVYAINTDKSYIVITVYEPDATLWEKDFKTRRNTQ